MILIRAYYQLNNSWKCQQHSVRYQTPLCRIFQQPVYNKYGQEIPKNYLVHEDMQVFLSPPQN